jgi:hypothetical protein
MTSSFERKRPEPEAGRGLINRPDSYVPLPRQAYRGRARSGTIIQHGDALIYVGPNPEATGPRPGPPILRVGLRGDYWETVAVFPNATAAETFIHALEQGAPTETGS